MASKATQKQSAILYKHQIRRLCFKMLDGNKSAERQLRKEIDNPIAQTVIEEAIRSLSKTQRIGLESGRVKARSLKNSYKHWISICQG